MNSRKDSTDSTLLFEQIKQLWHSSMNPCEMKQQNSLNVACVSTKSFLSFGLFAFPVNCHTNCKTQKVTNLSFVIYEKRSQCKRLTINFTYDILVPDSEMACVLEERESQPEMVGIKDAALRPRFRLQQCHGWWTGKVRWVRYDRSRE